MTGMIRRHAAPVSLLVLAVMVGACGRGHGSGDAAAETTAAATSRGGVKTLPGRPDVCGFVPAVEATKLIGRLAGAPFRVSTTDDTVAASDGKACLYPLAARDKYGNAAAVIVEVEPDGATNMETATGMVGGIIGKQLGPGVSSKPDTSDDARRLLAGWDYLGGLGPEIYGRVGHVAISGRWNESPVSPDSVVRLVTLVRDRIPDLPFLADGEGHEAGGGEDACALLTQTEAETVLGPLAMPPYHSRDATALADPTGTGCTYYTPGHRAFSIGVTWEMGKRLFTMIAGMSQTVESKTGAPSAAADTLEGPWDQAAGGIDGSLHLLTGDRILTVSYRASRTNLAGAVKLAAMAAKRLGAR